MQEFKRELAFLKRHPTYAVRAISIFYPLSAEQLRKFRHLLLWDHVCENEEINWSTGLIQTFLQHLKDDQGRLHSFLLYNRGITFSVELIRQFESLWHWDILGEQDRVRRDPVIQRTFEKQFKPVNAWIAYMEGRSSSSKSNFKEITEEERAQIKRWTSEELEACSDAQQWSEISAGSGHVDWSISLLERFEKVIDFSSLYMNWSAWTACFGKLSNDNVDRLLSDKELLSRVELPRWDKPEDPAETSHYTIPKCMTYEYFLKQNKDKFPDAKA
jgi:hypothetical protein